MAKDWPSKFPASPGVYIMRTEKEYLYIGETADIRARMKDLQDTRNHSLRRSIGKKLTGIVTTASKKFESPIENSINDWLQANARVTFLQTFLARKELEEWLIKRCKPIYNRATRRSNIL